MQQDFHYAAIRVLAEQAGFSPDEAQCIALASQYVDDAVEHKPMGIENPPACAQKMLKEGFFDPVCTAHKGLRYLTYARKDSQRKVYIPFHFLPPDEDHGQKPFRYRVSPDSPLARDLLTQALLALKSADEGQARRRALIKLGIALHSYADTWAHQGFSGRLSAQDNDIEELAVKKKGRWEPLNAFQQLIHNMAPDIGHAEAVHFPDTACLQWRYVQDEDGQEVTADNPSRFLEAARRIYLHLCAINGKLPQWQSVEDTFMHCFEQEADEDSSVWQQTFQVSPFGYDMHRFRRDSLVGDRVDWDDFQLAGDFACLQLKATENHDWFFFHLEAKAQREYITKRIRNDLLSL